MSELPEVLDYLKKRRSVTSPFLSEPGPNAHQLAEMMEIAARVPDHGKLAPWRLMTYSGDARAEIGARLAAIAKANNPELNDAALEIEKRQFLPAPLTVGVLSAPRAHPKIPEFEQLLCAGNVALNLVHAANAMGFGAHWVTRWFAYDAKAAHMLGAQEGERFVAFVHIGTAQTRLEERDRPDVAALTRAWNG